MISGPVLWSPDEDKLLNAIVHEFGSNWSLVCDVLASSTAMQGIARNCRQCKDRYKEIQVRPAHSASVSSSRLTPAWSAAYCLHISPLFSRGSLLTAEVSLLRGGCNCLIRPSGSSLPDSPLSVRIAPLL